MRRSKEERAEALEIFTSEFVDYVSGEADDADEHEPFRPKCNPHRRPTSKSGLMGLSS